MSENLKFPNHFMDNQFVPFAKAEEIDQAIQEIGTKISEKYKGQELILVTTLRGSAVFMADLVRKIKNVKVYIDFIQVEAVGRSKEATGTIRILKDITTNIHDKNVLIVEDIIDTGRALHFIKSRLVASAPKGVEIVALFNKPNKRIINIEPDYVGHTITEEFIIGYGMDFEEYGRNLSTVYALKYAQ